MRILMFLVLMAVALYANSFNLKDMDEATIEKAIPCGEFICALVSKGDAQYIIIGKPIDGVFYINSVFLVEDKKARKVWDITWKEV